MHCIEFAEQFGVWRDRLYYLTSAWERMCRSLYELFEGCEVRDEAHSLLVCFGNKKCWAAPSCGLVDGCDDLSFQQLRDCLLRLRFLVLRNPSGRCDAYGYCVILQGNGHRWAFHRFRVELVAQSFVELA